MPHGEPRAAVGLILEEALELAEEFPRLVQQLGAQPVELGFFEEEVLADTGVERLDGVHGEVEPSPLAVVGGREIAVGPLLHREHHGQAGQGHQQRRGDGDRRRPPPPHPPPGPLDHWFGPGQDRLVGHPPLDVLGQRSYRGVAIRRLERHRLEADRLECRRNRTVHLTRGGKRPVPDPFQERDGVLAFEGSPIGQEDIQRGAQAVEIAAAIQVLQVPRRLLRAHVLRRAQRRAR